MPLTDAFTGGAAIAGAYGLRVRRERMHKRLLDEIALAGPEHLDADYVAGYERKAGVDPLPISRSFEHAASDRRAR